MRRAGVMGVVCVVGLLSAACSGERAEVGAPSSSTAVSSISPSPALESAAPESSTSASDAAAASEAAGRVGQAMERVRAQSFLGILSVESLQYGDMKFADDATVVAAARTVCADLSRRVPRPQVVGTIAENYGGDSARAEEFTTQAVSVYCPSLAR